MGITYKLIVRAVDHKCLDSSGEWDRTWDTSYEWLIVDEDWNEVRGMGGYDTEANAREAGEEKLRRLEEGQ
jgi:hypothetical protein